MLILITTSVFAWEWDFGDGQTSNISKSNALLC